MDAFITLISFPVLFQSSATGARQRVDNKLETCMHSTTSLMSTRDRIGAILRVTSGNFLEQFDFFLFGFYATYIAHTFFPASSEFASLMMTFAVFGAGFLMRPIGAIVLGAYIDKVGRRKGLIVTLSIMATGTFLIVLIPSYQTIGLWAPLLVLIGRLLQGFSAGAELGGVSVYLAEIATPGRKGFYTSWQSGSQQVAIMVAAAMGFALNAVLEQSAISDWGWRIPFLFGCLIVPFIFILRRKLEETQEFTARRHHLAMRQVFATLLANWLVRYGCRGAVRPLWPPVGADRHDPAGAGYRLACADHAGERPELFDDAERAAVAVVYLRHVQRGDDPGADRNYARRSARGRFLAGLQPGDRGVWRLHAGDFHGAD
jgi:MHS family citrate/tricarballylate:H+ symporter-like MFS transporter